MAKPAKFAHIVYRTRRFEEMVGWYARVFEARVQYRNRPTLSLYYKDPDGNRIEFQVDCFATADEANAYMQGDAFAANPIGVNFDADELVEQFRKGVPERQLLARPEGPPAIPAAHGLGA